jgi:hypothetical protein
LGKRTSNIDLLAFSAADLVDVGGRKMAEMQQIQHFVHYLVVGFGGAPKVMYGKRPSSTVSKTEAPKTESWP